MKALLLLVPLLACRPDIDPAGIGASGGPPVERRAEPIPRTGILDFDPSQLPPGVRGRFPSFDGDSFAVTMPARDLTTMRPREVFDEVVSPLMRAMGFGARVEAMIIPRRGFVFQQADEGVPIETAAVMVGPASAYGTLFNRYGITNTVSLSADAVAGAVAPELVPIHTIDLILLPYGGTPDGGIALRYAYRTLLAERPDTARTWLAWVDAESGDILQLTPQFDDEER